MLLPAIGFLTSLIVIAVLIVVGIFVLAYVQSEWGMGNSKWSLIAFVAGGFFGVIGAVGGFSVAANSEYFGSMISRVYVLVGPSLTKVGVISAFLLFLSIAVISGGIFVVWIGDRLTSVRKSA
jgi:hypothetical protein